MKVAVDEALRQPVEAAGKVNFKEAAKLPAEYALHATRVSASAASTVSSLSIAMCIVSALVAFAICGGLLALMRGVVRPIGAMTSAMEKLAGGDLEARIPSASHRDEIGAMACAVQVFKDSALRVRKMEADEASQLVPR